MRRHFCIVKRQEEFIVNIVWEGSVLISVSGDDKVGLRFEREANENRLQTTDNNLREYFNFSWLKSVELDWTWVLIPAWVETGSALDVYGRQPIFEAVIIEWTYRS